MLTSEAYSVNQNVKSEHTRSTDIRAIANGLWNLGLKKVLSYGSTVGCPLIGSRVGYQSADIGNV